MTDPITLPSSSFLWSLLTLRRRSPRMKSFTAFSSKLLPSWALIKSFSIPDWASLFCIFSSTFWLIVRRSVCWSSLFLNYIGVDLKSRQALFIKVMNRACARGSLEDLLTAPLTSINGFSISRLVALTPPFLGCLKFGGIVVYRSFRIRSCSGFFESKLTLVMSWLVFYWIKWSMMTLSVRLVIDSATTASLTLHLSATLVTFSRILSCCSTYYRTSVFHLSRSAKKFSDSSLNTLRTSLCKTIAS